MLNFNPNIPNKIIIIIIHKNMLYIFSVIISKNISVRNQQPSMI